MIISDTIHYRADGTVSSVTRTTRETYTKPSGVEATEDVHASITLDAVQQHLGDAYSEADKHNKDLEAQIEALRTQLANMTAVAERALGIVATVRSADAQWSERVSPLLAFGSGDAPRA